VNDNSARLLGRVLGRAAGYLVMGVGFLLALVVIHQAGAAAGRTLGTITYYLTHNLTTGGNQQ
jgi:hypothetical protein